MNEKKKSLIITIAVILCAIAVIGLAAYGRLYNSGIFQRSKIAAKTENYSVDGMMFAYFFGSQYQQIASYASYLGLDTSKSLKSQSCPYLSDGGSWYDYFIDMTSESVGEMLTLCEIAREKGIELTSEDKDGIAEQVKGMKDSAAMYGYTFEQYMTALLGNPVNEKDLRKCLELNTLAGKASQQVTDEFSYTAEQLDAYATENADSFLGMDYCVTTLNASSFRVYDEDQNPVSTAAEESRSAMQAAAKLAGTKTADEFKSALKEIMTANAESDEDIEAALEDAENIHIVKASLTDEISDWMDSASVGQTMQVGAEGDESFTVYLLTKKAYRDDAETRDIRHILFTHDTYEDSSKADEVYAELEAAGFTEEKFTELAAEYSEDPGSSENGGLYENVTEGSMVEEFDEWLFDASRKPGDHAVVETEDYGWHIMYYVGKGDKTVWELAAENALRQEDYSDLIDSRRDAVTFNEKVLASIGD